MNREVGRKPGGQHQEVQERAFVGREWAAISGRARGLQALRLTPVLSMLHLGGLREQFQLGRGRMAKDWAFNER